MPRPSPEQILRYRQEWTDRLVRYREPPPAHATRFQGRVGRVITINWSGRAIVDFADGAWYDVPDFETWLEIVTDPADAARYDPTINSAQPCPPRQS